MSSKTYFDPHKFTYPFNCTILSRPSCPDLVGQNGTAINVTEDQQIRVVVDSKPGDRWARTICVLVEEIVERT